MQIIEKDILTVDYGYICHQVNCQGVMGSGLAKSIRDKWPHIYDKYREYCSKSNWRYDLLGEYLKVYIENLFVYEKKGLAVVNIFGQYNFGMGTNHTQTGALNRAFSTLAETNKQDKVPVYFPYKFASDRAGGDWEEVSRMIGHYFPDAIICKLP